MRNVLVFFITAVFISCSADEKIKRKDTEDLFYLFVRSDISRNMYLHNSMQQGFEFVRDQSNVLQELLRRPDTGRKLLKIYKDVNLIKIEGRENFHLLECIQRIVAQSEVIGNMTDKEINEYVCLQLHCQETIIILSETNKNWSYPESLGGILFGLGNVMFRYDFAPFMQVLESNSQICGMMESGMAKNIQDVELVRDCIVKFMNNRSNGSTPFCGEILF